MENVIQREFEPGAALLADSVYDAEALFPDAESAIKFALKAPTSSPTRDTLGSMRSGGRKGTFDRDELPGQAGMIMAALKPLTEQAKALLIARLALRSMPCNCKRSCCVGWAVNPDWDNARAFLAMATVEAISGSMTQYQMRDGLVRRWAGEKVNAGRLADSCGVHRQTVAAHQKLIKDWLQQRYKQAVIQADSLLRGGGLNLESLPELIDRRASAKKDA